MMPRFVILLTVLFLLPLPVHGQDDPRADFEDLVVVQEVQLDVLATDPKGRLVLGLGAEDFLVEEEGEPVEITGVSFYTTRYGEGGEPPAAGEVPASRYFILFFHDPITGGTVLNYRTRQRMHAERGCLEWIADHLGPSDWVAVVGHDVHLKVYQDFVQDRHALEEAVRAAALRRNPDRGRGRRGRQLPPLGSPSLLRHLPRGKDLSRQTRTLYDGLRLTAEAAAYIVGRKNLLLFSTGLGGLDLTGAAPEPDPLRYPPMVEALNHHNVAVYTIDYTPSEVRHVQGLGLERLALGTGGAYFRDPIDYSIPLRRIAEETTGYYLISYQSARRSSESGFQRVRVKAKNSEIRVRARQGYLYGSE
jgi:VWFA-related protein